MKDKLRASVFDDATTAAAVAGEKGGGAAAGGPARLPRVVRRVKIELITRIWSIFDIFLPFLTRDLTDFVLEI